MDCEEFLQRLVDFINEIRTQKRQEVYQLYANEIAEYYYSHGNGSVLGQLKEALETDVELLSLLLFALQFITEDKICVQELQQLLLREDIDVHAALDISFQLANLVFRNAEISLPYLDCRRVHEHLLMRVETELIGDTAFLPYKERNKKRIILATDTLLGLFHAPTKIVYQTADRLKLLGYDVVIIVNVRTQPLKRSEQYCILPFSPNYNKQLQQCNVFEYASNRYSVYQFFFCEEDMEQQKEMLQFIYDWKPLCVWYIGGSSPVADIYRRTVTQISMGCTDGYLCTCSPVLLSYMQSNSANVKKSIEYSLSHGQKIYNIKLADRHSRENPSLTRRDLGIPEKSFALCIVGNRLDAEISQGFIEMLRELVDESEEYHVVLIGKCKSDILQGIEEERQTRLGFRTDLIDVIAMTDLFVNPPRQGAGGGAVRAFAVGVPAVTCPNCDVSNVTGPDFCCQNLEEMKELIRRYSSDSEFYHKQQEKAYEVYREREHDADNSVQAIGEMLDQVKQWLEDGEIQ